MDELRISASHKVGVFRYMVGHLKNTHEPAPMEVYVEECQLNITKGYDEYDDGMPMSDVWHVETKYKVNRRGHAWWVKSDEIYDTKEDVLKHIEYQQNEKNNKV